MPNAGPPFDRGRLRARPLCERVNKVFIERDHVPVDARPRPFDEVGEGILAEAVARMRAAREAGRSRMLAFGAHTIKNGLAPVLIGLIESGWVTHLATNGAGIIHDWEFAFQGASSEDVAGYIAEGQFGIWEETGRWLNLAIVAGAFDGLGYGASVGRLVAEEGLTVPGEDELRRCAVDALTNDPERAAAAADFLAVIQRLGLAPGRHALPHPFNKWGVQAAAWRFGVPFTGHPMIGHDIIYAHAANHCAAIGRAAERDFLTFAAGVREIDGGVYLSVGSAVMSPMVFEKSLSMARNVAHGEGDRVADPYILVADLQPSRWDWREGEPPEDNPDYYLRYCKTFSRTGGTMRYMQADNRDLLLALLQRLDGIEPARDWKTRGAPR